MGRFAASLLLLYVVGSPGVVHEAIRRRFSYPPPCAAAVADAGCGPVAGRGDGAGRDRGAPLLAGAARHGRRGPTRPRATAAGAGSACPCSGRRIGYPREMALGTGAAGAGAVTGPAAGHRVVAVGLGHAAPAPGPGPPVAAGAARRRRRGGAGVVPGHLAALAFGLAAGGAVVVPRRPYCGDKFATCPNRASYKLAP